MCSICRNKNCIYKFSQKSWGPPEDLVTYQLPESDLTIMEQIKIAEDQIKSATQVRVPKKLGTKL